MPSPLALPATSTERKHQIADIEAALATGGLRLRFTPWLEKGYEELRSPARNRSIAHYLVIYLAAKLLFLWCNLKVGSTVFRVSMTLRLGIVLPLTLIAGIYGTNFGRGFSVPGSNYSYGFYIMIVVMIGVSAGLIAVFRRKGWI